MQTPTITRRAGMAGTAALPALVFPAAAAAPDPTIAAVRGWFAAEAAERSHAYTDSPNDDHANALSAEADRPWQAMIATPPTTAAGFALMLAAYLYAVEGCPADAHSDDPESGTSTTRASTLAGFSGRSGAARRRPSSSGGSRHDRHGQPAR